MQDYIILLHLAFLAVAALGIALADISAFAWIRGHDDTAHPGRTLRLHSLVTVGLTGLVCTGLYLFWPLREYLLHQPLFWLKMLFVAALIINSFFIEMLMSIATERPYSKATQAERTKLFISGGLSSLSWLGAALSAILLFRWPFLKNKIKNS